MGRRSRALVVGLGLALALLPGARASGSGPEAAPLAAPLGTGVTYQGFLKQNGVPANGPFPTRRRGVRRSGRRSPRAWW
jgi:hypothetical protein